MSKNYTTNTVIQIMEHVFGIKERVQVALLWGGYEERKRWCVVHDGKWFTFNGEKHYLHEFA